MLIFFPHGYPVILAPFFLQLFFGSIVDYNVVLVSGVQHSDSVIYMYIYMHTYIYTFSDSFPL